MSRIKNPVRRPNIHVIMEGQAVFPDCFNALLCPEGTTAACQWSTKSSTGLLISSSCCNGSICFTMFPNPALALGLARQRRKRKPRSSCSSSSLRVTNRRRSVLSTGPTNFAAAVADGSVSVLSLRLRHPGTLRITSSSNISALCPVFDALTTANQRVLNDCTCISTC